MADDETSLLTWIRGFPYRMAASTLTKAHYVLLGLKGGDAMTAYFKDQTVQDLDKLLSQAKGLKARFEPIWYLLAYHI